MLRAVFAIMLLLPLNACLQNWNSFSGDTAGGETDVSALLAAECAPCHQSGGTNTPFVPWATDEFISQNYVIAGDPDGSLLYRRMKGIGGGVMPPAGILSTADLAQVEDWICELGSQPPGCGTL